MFDISFGELLVIGVVALVVLGPEKLPKVARALGAVVGRMQRFVSSVKADIQREGQLAGLQELQNELRGTAQAFQQRLEGEVAEARNEFQQLGQPAQQLAEQVSDTLASADAQLRAPVSGERPALNPPDDAQQGDAACPQSEAASPAARPSDDQLDLFAPGDAKTSPPATPPAQP